MYRWLSLSTMLVPGMEDKLSGLVLSPITHHAALLALYWNNLKENKNYWFQLDKSMLIIKTVDAICKCALGQEPHHKHSHFSS